MSDTITLAPFASEHLPAALALSRAEAWPHRAEDWALLSSLSRASSRWRMAGSRARPC